MLHACTYIYEAASKKGQHGRKHEYAPAHHRAQGCLLHLRLGRIRRHRGSEAGTLPYHSHNRHGRVRRHHRAFGSRQVHARIRDVWRHPSPLQGHALRRDARGWEGYLRHHAHGHLTDCRLGPPGHRYADGRLRRRGRDALRPRELRRAPYRDRRQDRRDACNCRHHRSA